MTLTNRLQETTFLSLADRIRERLRCGSAHCRCHRPRGNVHCPRHTDRTPSLSVTPTQATLLVHCFSGCTQQQVVDSLKAMGVWLGARFAERLPAKVAKAANPSAANCHVALRIWSESQAANGTLVQAYLSSRGLNLVPPSIRFAPSLRHAPSAMFLPAMVAGVAEWPTGRVKAIQRTYLAPDGLGKAEAVPNKMSLGPVRGGAVWLAPPGEHLIVAEGIETALSVQQACGIPAWATLSASNFTSLVLPDLPLAEEVIIAADNDPAGLKSAYAVAEAWTKQGRRVKVALPPPGEDFNDLLGSAS